MKKWTRRSADRPTELAQAALELSSSQGVQAMRVADVAARAGVTVGTVYRYYPDKDALVAAALALGSRPAGRAASADRPGAALPALAEALRRWGAFFRTAGSRAVRVSLSDPRRDASATTGIAAEAVAEIAALITNAVARKEMRADIAPVSAARALVGALLLVPVLGAPADDDSDADIEAVAALATRGLRPDGPSWRPAGG